MPAGGCSIGLLVLGVTAGGAAAGGATAASSRMALVHEDDGRAASLLDALGARLVAGSWLVETVEMPQDASGEELARALEGLCTSPRLHSLVLALGSATVPHALCDVASALTSKQLGGVGSLMREACMGHHATSALLGRWGASTFDGTLVVTLPPHVDAAVACLDVVLPAVPHAVALASEGTRRPPQLRPR